MVDVINQWWAYITTTHYVEITVRLFLATLLGGLVGLEREQSNRPAGFRTHILVCVGSALIMLISMYGFEEFFEGDSRNVRADPARLAAQVVSGIGFLGAGTILVHGFAVRGLTTAASLWVVAGIGLALGSGFYYGAFIATALVLSSLVLLSRFERFFLRRSQLHTLHLKIVDTPGILGQITTRIGENDISIRQLTIEESPGKEEGFVRLSIVIRSPGKMTTPLVVEQLGRMEGVHEVNLDT